MKGLLPALVLASAIAIHIAPPASAQTHPSAQTENGTLEIIVTAVQGSAQYRPPGEAKWKALTQGLQLVEGTELRTGTKGSVQFKVLPDQVYRVDRLTAIKILRANLQNGTIKTDLGMTYGRVSKDLDAPSRPHDDTIVSPSSTLAVRGTRVSLYDQPPYTAEAVSLTGTAVFQNAKRQAVAFGAKGQGKTSVTADNPDPAGNALAASIVDPTIAYARTPAEERLLAYVISRGAVVSFDTNLGIPVVTGGTVPGDPLPPEVTPGDLNFVVRWSGNTNVDTVALVLGENQSEFLFPRQGINTTPFGGRIPFDHRGGPNGGFEIAFWPAGFQLGNYVIEAVNNGSVTANVRINAFVNNGKGLVPQPLVTNPNVFPFTTANEFDATVVPGDSTATEAFVGVPVPGQFAKKPGAAARPLSIPSRTPGFVGPLPMPAPAKR